MKRRLIRLYDKRDEYSMQGERYFIVLNGTWDELSDSDFTSIADAITNMDWQNYTSYAVGVIDDLKKEELRWSEIMGYTMHEVKVDVDRVKNIKKYKLPEIYTYGMDL